MKKKIKNKKMINYTDDQKKILKVLYWVKLIYLIVILAVTLLQLAFGPKISLLEFGILFGIALLIEPVGKLVTGFKKKGFNNAKSD